jgi:orotate phosphoribosyltransferase
MDILETLAARGAILKDLHFVYKSGKHGPHYINMDPVFPDIPLVLELGQQLGEEFRLGGNNMAFWSDAEVVVAAATGGIPLAFATALSLNHGESQSLTTWAWADKDGDNFVFERAGFVGQLSGKRVLVVEDLLNTGDTVKKVIAQVREHGGTVIGVSVVCNRGSETAESLDIPRLEQLAQVDFYAEVAELCTPCALGEPIVVDIGHGKQYQHDHPDYHGGYITVLS